MKKILILSAFLVSAASLQAADVLEAIVVRVGDRIVTRTQYAKRLRDAMAEVEQTAPAEQVAARKATLQQNMVNEIISELLIKDRADRIGLSVSDAEVKDAVVRLKQQYGITTDEQFEESLRKSGLSRTDMEARLRDTLITNKVFARELRNRAELSDRELKARYDREKETYRLPERAHLREIVIIRPERALDIEAARQQATEVGTAARTPNSDFGKIATTMSQSGTKDKGGDLGEVKRGELLPELDKAVFNSTAGTVLGPIETKSAWHILKVESRLPSEVPAFESVKDRLRRDASEDAFNRDYKAYIENLRKDAYIQIHEENIPKT